MKYLLLLLSLIYSIISDFDEDQEIDSNSCRNIDYTTKNCWSAEIKLSDYECCLFETINIDDHQLDRVCNLIEKRTSKIFGNNATAAIAKEIYGFQQAKNPYFSSNVGQHISGSNITCENFKYNNYEISLFSESEVTILKSEDHCLKYDFLMFEMPQEEATEELCKKLKILPVSEKEGIKCALFEISFESQTIKTCHLFNTNSNELDILTNETINEIIGSIDKETTTPFKIKISWDGISSYYDSQAGELTSINENKNKTKHRAPNKSEFNTISKYLLLVLLSLL